jgi:hypothetical protein
MSGSKLEAFMKEAVGRSVTIPTNSEARKLAAAKIATIAFIVIGVCVAIYAITVNPNGPIDPSDPTKMIGVLP